MVCPLTFTYSRIMVIWYLIALTVIFLIRATAAEDRWPVLRHFFLKGRCLWRITVYTYLSSHITQFSKNLSWNFQRYALKKLNYIQAKDFCTLLVFKKSLFLMLFTVPLSFHPVWLRSPISDELQLYIDMPLNEF